MPTPSKAALALMIALFAWLWSAVAAAHDLRPATLGLVEHEDGRVDVSWTPPVQAGREIEGLAPVYPDHCSELGPNQLDCGEQGLRGRLSIRGLAGSSVEVIVQVHSPGGHVEVAALRERNPDYELGALESSREADAGEGAPSARRQLAWVYLGIGVEHIVLGIDHVLFVLGLLFVVGFERRLVWTITAFTLAHSITLACSVLDILRVPIAPVEAVIALSILLVASEACHERPTLTRRAPWAVAFAFGLLHGFGFAGALREIGLPDQQLGLGLLCFNLGVELGQLGIVVLCFGIGRLLAGRGERLRLPALYAMGTAAAYWAIERVLIALGMEVGLG